MTKDKEDALKEIFALAAVGYAIYVALWFITGSR